MRHKNRNEIRLVETSSKDVNLTAWLHIFPDKSE